ncbi:MAG: acyltransferase family protein [Phycisphaerales bacterium]|nr:MAG: acyltransferase family protein [Phycisphaerales bacterium]
MPPERSRNIQYINRLRILAIYLVVTAHVAIWLAMEAEPFTFDWWVGAWLFYLGHASIPIFVMISGALLLDDSRHESIRQFYQRRLLRVGVPLTFWTGVYLAARVFIDGEHLSVARAIRLILAGDPYYHLWFLYMIFGLYLVTPALRVFVRCADQAQRLSVIVVGLILANAYFQTDVLLWDDQRSIFTMFLPYIPYYLCGYELHRIDPKRVPLRYLVLAVVVSALYLAAFFNVFMARQGGVGVRYLFDFFTPPLAFLSIGIFWAAYLHDATSNRVTGIRRTALEWVASTTLGIYVLHPLVLEGVRRALSGRAGEGTFIAGVTVVPLITFVVCDLITSMLMNVPILRRTVH